MNPIAQFSDHATLKNCVHILILDIRYFYKNASVVKFKKLCGAGGSIVHPLCANLHTYERFFHQNKLLSHCFSHKFEHWFWDGIFNRHTHHIPKDTTVCIRLHVLWNYQHLLLQKKLLFKKTIECYSKIAIPNKTKNQNILA